MNVINFEVLFFRSLAGLTGASKSKIQNHFWSIIVSTVLNVSTLPQFLYCNGNIASKRAYWHTLAATTRRHREQYEIFIPLCRNGQHLIIGVIDSTKYRTSRSNDITVRKATYTGYTR